MYQGINRVFTYVACEDPMSHGFSHKIERCKKIIKKMRAQEDKGLCQHYIHCACIRLGGYAIEPVLPMDCQPGL